ncbi:YcxB family protein [Clostridium sp. UBA4395]|uniref:YcxB family protein n=1 Tax=Clostridium sp. UBA4395 TaxID=1946360 RepID=UPI0032173321
MTLKYTNSLEDWIEFHYFLDTIKKNRIFYFKFRKIVLYACYLYFIVATIKFIKLYYLHTKLVVTFCIFTLTIAILLYKIVKLEPKFYLSRLKKTYKLAIEKNPNLVKEKEVFLKLNKFVVTVDNSETEIHFESIFNIFENNDKIYVLNKKYKALLIIPCEAFKDNDEKLDFLSRIKK